MALNVYEAEMRISFGEEPSSYFGWYVSWSGDPDQRTDFSSEADRTSWEIDVARAMDDEERQTYWDVQRCAAIRYCVDDYDSLEAQFPLSASAVDDAYYATDLT